MADTAPIEVDARGLYCPLPILRLASALRSHPTGTRARLLATDPIAVRDVEAFCAAGRGRLLSRSENDGVLAFEVEKTSL
ncbi:MAG TPA: sulfurtransferase TusA family protein [Thermoanaerobaculia bacterium]|nr:sulfurtransferase TusA family protein [Thermoanaerobaculia bacterium]